MKVKVGVALGIFLLLFSSSWILDQKQTRSASEVKTIENSQGLMNISNAVNNESPILDTTPIRFAPREYIRVEYKELKKEIDL